ncbi:DUF167 family protein [Pedomonas mirosovicensis]|uniref:DUF167 family protein n=1 Tax=Pedomonas mirosovicensis TaxID=2908641 RepID=UPI00216A4D2A|nr:DUF167 family protein [Pedomonas mirosovicensis]MCH8684091.1 DUF167 family protein [Pedomonas mirosovicensis]
MNAAAPRSEAGLRVSVRVTPKGGRDAITGASRDEAGQCRLTLKVSAPPAEGAANAAVVALIAKTFQVSKSRVSMLRGDTAREKLLLIEGDMKALEDRFAELERSSS